MTQINTQPIGVIADDFTGAIDAGVEFVRAGFATTFVITPNPDQTTQVEVVSTDSRDGDAQTARERAAQAAEQLRGRRIFKKIDSTMRGHLGDEITTILRVLGRPKALVCPAAIEAGRTVRAGQLWIHDLPLHRSDFAHDPRWPAATADMGELLGVPTTHIPLATIHAGAGALAAAISHAPTAIVTVDACDHEDLERVSEAILLTNSLPCGALGLARAWAGQGSGSTNPLAALGSELRDGPTLIVAGSRHPRTRAQVDALLATGRVSSVEATVPIEAQRQQEAATSAIAALSAGRPTVIRAPLLDIANPHTQRLLVEALGDLTLRICAAIRPGALILTGGETASAISQRLGTTGVRILGEVEVGVPWGILLGGIAAHSLVVTKAGGFGSENALVHAVEALR